MDFVAHASERLAQAIVRACWHTCDPRTLAEWARATALTTWQLRAWCQVAQVHGRDVLAFVRALRAVIKAEIHGCGYEEVLDIAEPRTLDRFLRRAGILQGRTSAHITTDEFLARQKFLKKPELVQRVCELVADEASRRRKS